jgi:hypothetical protein
LLQRLASRFGSLVSLRGQPRKSEALRGALGDFGLEQCLAVEEAQTVGQLVHSAIVRIDS